VIGTADITVGGSTIKAIWYCTDSQGNVTQTIVEPTAIPPSLPSLETPGTFLAYTGYISVDENPATYFSSRTMPTLVRYNVDFGRDYVALSGVDRIIYIDAQFINGSFLIDANSVTNLVVANVALIYASAPRYGTRQTLWQPESYTP
jgi:hypothetical protein